MKHWKITSATFLALVGLSGSASAVEVYGGTGLGFSNNASQWVINMAFDKNDLKAGTEAMAKTGDDLTPDAQKGFGVTLKVPPTKSMAWCDAVSNPDITNNTDINQCYGWAMFSKWAVLDFNAIQKAGVKKVWVTITVKRYDDGVAQETDATGKVLPSDDDLIPGLTVFRGRQDVGAHLHWYPNKFQKESFWAWKLSPFYTGKKKTDKTGGWATANGPGNQDTATVVGKLVLKPGGQNYLSVAIGGDARHASASEKHDVNFMLMAKVTKKDPSASSSSSDGSSTGKLDKCGCEIGVTEWHPPMNHCMAIDLCTPLAGTADECKTPAMCEADGGR